jgi:3-hydroxyisobutyrate dehydrogenase-like beta-hydroxyacid dehydrogenase
MARVTVMGMGAMGARMAKRLVEAGHAVTVWNRTAAATAPLVALGAKAAVTPRAAAADAEIVLSMVRDDAAAHAVWLDPETGALAGMAQDAVAVESSTVTPEAARALHRACSAAGIACLDAPVAGSRPQADAGQLIFIVGGAESALRSVEPVLLAMGGAVHLAGGPGAGAVVKLMVNTLFGVQVAAMAELIGLARRNGIDPGRAVELIGSTPTASLSAKGAAAGMLAGNFAPMFPVALVTKDFGYAEALAGEPSQAPLLAAAHAVFARALAAGMGDDNLTGVVRLYG